MNLMGVDLGIHKVSCAVYRDGGLVQASTHPASDLEGRGRQLRELGRYCYDLGLSHDLDHVWIEDVIIGNNRKYSLQLAQTLGAVLCYLAGLPGVDVRTVDNKAWKKALLGNGNAAKEQIRDYIHVSHPQYAPFCDGDQDRYDATCVGLYGLRILDRASSLHL